MMPAMSRRADPARGSPVPILLLLVLVSVGSVLGCGGGPSHAPRADSGVLAVAEHPPTTAASARAGPYVPVDSTALPAVGATYAVTFGESGLSSGTRWSVTLAGTTSSSSSSTITFYEPNGTFSFSAGSVDGKSASPSSGSVTVNGAAQRVDLTFSSSAGFLGLSGANGYYFVLSVTAILIVGGVAAVVLHRRRNRELDELPPDDRPGR